MNRLVYCMAGAVTALAVITIGLLALSSATYQGGFLAHLGDNWVRYTTLCGLAAFGRWAMHQLGEEDG